MSPLDLIPAPYRLAAKVAVVALVVAALFGTGWSNGAGHVQSQWAAAAAKATAAQLVAEQAARQREHQLIDQLRKAQSDAAQREKTLQLAAASAGDASDKLRIAINTIRNGLPGNTIDTCRSTSDTALAVLSQCADQYRAVAAAADGHASDTQTLIEAWPR